MATFGDGVNVGRVRYWASLRLWSGGEAKGRRLEEESGCVRMMVFSVYDDCGMG